MTQEACGSLLLAHELAWAGASFVVVGGTARRLRTGRGRPRDLDVRVRPDDVPALAEALACLGVAAGSERLLDARDSRHETAWAPLDVLVGSRRVRTLDIGPLSVAALG